jgi:hypothetical protein
MIPDMINISEAKIHERYGLAQLIFSKTPSLLRIEHILTSN